MTKTILIGALVIVAMLFPVDGLRALGLGEARVDSYLGQPLDVTIRLIEADPEALEAMTVSPARAEDYERLGVPSEALAFDLDITVDRTTEPALIRVRSQRAVNDPVIRFLVDARWSSGRVLREYTLFLDPPTIDVAPPAPVVRQDTPRSEPAVSERVEPDREPSPERRRPAPPPESDRPAASPADSPSPIEAPAEPETVASPTRPVPSSPTEIEVGAGQTLWGIAAEWRPSERLTMNQVMLAIFDRNPAAFDDNVNRLLRGARLSLPSIEAVESLSAAEADRRIRQQMQAWREQMGQTEVPTIAESAVPEAEPEPVEMRETPAADDVVHRLDVIPPESDIFDEGPVVSEGEIRRASSRLAELEDEMYAEALENDEFVRRITSIREAIDSRDVAGLAVADEELAEFEARLRAAREAREESERLAAELAAEAPAADADDEVDSYFRQLEEEMAAAGTTDDAAEAAADPAAGSLQESATEPASPALAESEADGAGDELLTEPVVMPEATIGRSSEGSSWPWLLIGVGALLAVGGAAAVVLLLRRNGQSASAPTAAAAGAGMAVSAARERVRAKPEDLGAHLALLAALAERDDPDGFSAALDNMYRQVDDEDGPEWQEALNMAVIHAPDHPLLTPPETGLATDDDDEGLDDRTREMLGILPSSDEADTMAVEPDDYEFDSELEADRAEPDDIFSTESESYSRTSDQDTVRTSPPTESEDEDVEGHDLDLAELSRRLDTPEQDQPPGDDDEGQDEPDLTFAPETDRDDSTQVLPSAPVADEPDADDIEDELAADDPLRLDFEFSDRSSSGDTGRDQTLPLSDEFDLSVEAEDSSEDDLDTDELGADLAAEDDDLLDLDGGKDRSGEREESLDERGDRELEAFLSQDDDEGEPELSDEDAEVKLDLARAYLSMDDPDSARTLLEEITSGGSAAMRAEARKLLDQD